MTPKQKIIKFLDINGPRIRELELFIKTNTSILLIKNPDSDDTSLGVLIKDLNSVLIIQVEQAKEELKRRKG